MSSKFIIDLNEQNLQPTLELSLEKLVVISCWASQIPESLDANQVLEKIANKYQGAFILAKLNCETEQNIAMQLGVQSLPTIALFQQGRPVDGVAGPQTKETLTELLGKYLPNEDELTLSDAQKLVQSGEFAQALTLLRPLSANMQDNGQLHLLMAQAQIEINQFAEAQTSLDKVMLKDQDSLYQSLIAKLELHQQAADTPEIRALEEAHTTNPSDFSVSYQLALQYSQVNRDEEALTLLLQILRSDLNYEDGAVKKSMLDILSALGQENPLTGTYRRKLYTLLY